MPNNLRPVTVTREVIWILRYDADRHVVYRAGQIVMIDNYDQVYIAAGQKGPYLATGCYLRPDQYREHTVPTSAAA